MKTTLKILTLALLLTGASSAWGTTVNVYPDADTHLEEDNWAANFGSVTLNTATSWGTRRRTILRFTLPALSGTISKITLKLSETNGPGGTNQSIFSMTQTGWVEAQATWDNYKTGTAWASGGGGDYNATVVASSTSVASSSVESFVIQGTGALNPLTLTWGNTTNLIITNDNEDRAGGWAGSWWVSKEGGEGYRPYLSVEYTAPSSLSSATAMQIGMAF